MGKYICRLKRERLLCMMKLSQESLVKKFEYVKYVKALQAGELPSKYCAGMRVMYSMLHQRQTCNSSIIMELL